MSYVCSTGFCVDGDKYSTHFIFKRCNSLVMLRGIVKVIVAFSDEISTLFIYHEGLG